MDRLESATPDSPIAIFRTDQSGIYDVIFASTVTAQKRIRSDWRYVGTFSYMDCPNRLKERLRALSTPFKLAQDKIKGVRL
jgi:pyridoxal biosynthesis lyase PdxS